MANSSLPSKVLVIDMDSTVGQRLSTPLARRGINVLTANNYETACYLFNQNFFDVILVESSFREVPGPVIMQKWRQNSHPDKKTSAFISLAGNRDELPSGELNLLKELQGIEVIFKPVNELQILPYLQRAFVTKQKSIKREQLRQSVDQLVSAGKVNEAIAATKEQLPSLGHNGIDILVGLLEHVGDNEQALGVINEALKHDAANVFLQNLKGKVLIKLNKNEDALKLFDHLDEKSPNKLSRIKDLIHLFLEHNQPDQSVEKMKQYLTFHPENPDLKFEMLEKLHDKGFDNHASRLGQQISNPMEIVRYYNNLGVAKAKTNDYLGAIKEYQKSLRYFPDFKENYRIYYNLAMAHLSLKSKEQIISADEMLEKCLKLNSQFEKAIRLRESLKQKRKIKKSS